MFIMPLRTFLRQYRDEVEICVDKKYPLVTISNRGIVSLREQKSGAEIKADRLYRIKNGSFIYSRLAAHTGAFGLVSKELEGAVVTNEMPIFEIDKNVILPDYLSYVLRQKSFLAVLNKLTRGMGRVRIKEDVFLQQKIKIHKNVDTQRKILASLKSRIGLIASLNSCYLDQAEYFSLLRKTIFQEAIEGKLSYEWRKKNHELISGKNHASKLLENIQQARERLMKEGEIRRVKMLKPISEFKKPFILPDGWAYCRINDVIKQFVDCPHSTPHYVSAGKICLRSQNVIPNSLNFEQLSFITDAEYQFRISRLKPAENDLVYIREGGRLGVAGIINSSEDICLGQRLMLLRFFNPITSKFISMLLNAPQIFNQIAEKTIGSAAPHINVRDVVAHVIPLPPLFEQQAIVEKVHKLITMITKLEKQATENQNQSELLMQSVLQETFRG